MKRYLLYLSIFGFFFLNAQNDTLLIDEVIVQGNRIETKLSETSHAVVVIDKPTIEKLAVKSVDEVLASQSSIDIRRKGIQGIQTDIGIRGGSFEQVLIMIDGVKMNDAQTGHHNMNIPVHIENIESIEIIKGPAARRYGQNAYAGVVNINTIKPKKNNISAGGSFGSFDTWDANIGADLSQGNWSNRISGQYAKSGGYRYNTDFSNYNIWNTSRFDVGEKEITISGGFMEKKFGANGFYASPDFMDQYEEVQTSILSASTDLGEDKWTFTPRMYWRRNQDLYLFIREDPSVLRNLHIGNIVGLEVNSSYQHKLGTLGLGLEGKKDFLRSNNIGNFDRSIFNVFVDNRFIFGSFDATIGASISHYSDFGGFFYPGIDLGYKLDGNNKLFANWGITSRIPSYTDLYYMDRANVGNPDLKPEEANNFELGYRNIQNKLVWTTSLFLRNTKNLIDWTKEAESDPWKPHNVLDLSTRGLETSLQYYPSSPMIELIHVGYTYIDNEANTEGIPFSRYALENLNHKFNANVTFELLKDFSQTLSFGYLNRHNLDDYSLLDLRLEYRKNNLRFFGDVKNVFDTEYRESNLVPMPGRYFSVGFQANDLLR